MPIKKRYTVLIFAVGAGALLLLNHFRAPPATPEPVRSPSAKPNTIPDPSPPAPEPPAPQPQDRLSTTAELPASRQVLPAISAPPPAAAATPRRALIVAGVYNPAPREGEHGPQLDHIDELATTYDAPQVAELAAYLSDKSAEIRTAALDGLIRLGAPEASPFLRAAATRSKDPHETVALLDAAARLELPPLPIALRQPLQRQPKESPPPK